MYISAMITGIGEKLASMKGAIKTLDAVKIPKHPSQKEKLETVIVSLKGFVFFCNVSFYQMLENRNGLQIGCPHLWWKWEKKFGG